MSLTDPLNQRGDSPLPALVDRSEVRFVSVALATVFVAASCSSDAGALDEPRSIEIVTVFGDRDSADGDLAADNLTAGNGSGGIAPSARIVPSPTEPRVTQPVQPMAQPTRSANSTESNQPRQTVSVNESVEGFESGIDSGVTSVDSAPEPGEEVDSGASSPDVVLVPTVAPGPIRRIGLMNAPGDDANGSAAFGSGVHAVVRWAAGSGRGDGDAAVEVTTCQVTDAESSEACARKFSADGVDLVISGLDDHFDGSVSILAGASVPVIRGISGSESDTLSPYARLTFGGRPAEYGAMAAAAVAEGFGATVVLHDDTVESNALVDEFIIPVLESAGNLALKIAVPSGLAELDLRVAEVSESGVDSWIIAVGAPMCDLAIATRAQRSPGSDQFVSSACSGPETLESVGHLMEQSWLTSELISTFWYDVVTPDQRDEHSRAELIIAAFEPAAVGDPWAMMGYVAGWTAIEYLNRDLANRAAAAAPEIASGIDLDFAHPMAVGDFECGQSPNHRAICFADILMARYSEGSLVGPPMVINGIRGR